MTDKYAWPILLSEDALGGSHVFSKRGLRLLNNAHVVSVSDKNVVDTLPARAIGPSAMNQNDIADAILVILG
jgi:hypothetical protein